MGLLAKKGGDEEENPGGGFSLELEVMVCPTCQRELPPWQTVCATDGATLVRRADLQPSDGPAIPAHLLDMADEPSVDATPEEETLGDDSTTS